MTILCCIKVAKLGWVKSPYSKLGYSRPLPQDLSSPDAKLDGTAFQVRLGKRLTEDHTIVMSQLATTIILIDL